MPVGDPPPPKKRPHLRENIPYIIKCRKPLQERAAERHFSCNGSFGCEFFVKRPQERTKKQ